MSDYLLMWTLGPVQPFIEAARKTQDLWLGSYLLSTLMQAALAAARTDERNIIYPYNTRIEPSSVFADLPNTFVARYTGEAATRAAAQEAQDKLFDKWNSICAQVWDNLADKVPEVASAKLVQSSESLLPVAENFPTALQSHELETNFRKAVPVWDLQLKPEHIFEIYWVAAPLSSEPGQYGATFKELRAALNDRKRTRTFPQVLQNGEKSTITGEHAALHLREQPGRAAVRALWRTIGEHYGAKFIRADGSERLGAVDTVKRLAASGQAAPLRRPPYSLDFNRFPSTSTIAAAPFFKALLDHWLVVGKGVAEWLSELHELDCIVASGSHPIIADQSHEHVLPMLNLAAPGDPRTALLQQDGDTFFNATYTSKKLQRDFGLPEATLEQHRPAIEQWCVSARGRLRTLVEQVRDLDRQRRIARAAELAHAGEELAAWCEYANKQAEGRHDDAALLAPSSVDLKELVRLVRSMAGEILAPPTPYFAVLLMDGDDMGETIGAVVDQEAHRQISRALSTFAHAQAPQIVQGAYPARLVYSGGDDVLALAPIEHALRLAEELRLGYAETLRGEGQCQDPHASAGICIAHHQDPLSRTLRMARAAEHVAKHAYCRNSIAVTLLRRSGEQTSIGAPWQYRTGDASLDLWTVVFDLFRSDLLSPKFAGLVAVDAPILADLPTPARCAELRRLLLRQRASPALLPDSCAAFLATELVAVGAALDDHLMRHGVKLAALPSEFRDSGPRRGIVEVGGWLSLLAFMARGDRS